MAYIVHAWSAAACREEVRAGTEGGRESAAVHHRIRLAAKHCRVCPQARAKRLSGKMYARSSRAAGSGGLPHAKRQAGGRAGSTWSTARQHKRNMGGRVLTAHGPLHITTPHTGGALQAHSASTVSKYTQLPGLVSVAAVSSGVAFVRSQWYVTKAARGPPAQSSPPRKLCSEQRSAAREAAGWVELRQGWWTGSNSCGDAAATLGCTRGRLHLSNQAAVAVLVLDC